MRTTRLLPLALLAGIALTAAPPAPLRGQDVEVRVATNRGWLGFSYGADRMVWTSGDRTPSAREATVIVGEVLKGSPADRAGMEPGDTIVRVNGEEATLTRIGTAARRLQPGDTVRLQVRRAGKEHALTLVAAKRPAYVASALPGFGEGRTITIDGDSIRRVMRIYLDSARLKLDSMPFPHTIMRHDSVLILQYGRGGKADTIRLPRMDSLRTHMRVFGDSMLRHMPNVRVYSGRDVPDFPGFDVEVTGRRGIAGAAVQELNSQLAAYFGVREGLLVESVAAGTPAAKAGLQAGDVVTGANGGSINDVGDLRRALRGRSGDVKLDIVRKGKKQQLSLKWP